MRGEAYSVCMCFFFFFFFPLSYFWPYFQTAAAVDKSGPLGSCVIPDMEIAAGALAVTEQVTLDSLVVGATQEAGVFRSRRSCKSWWGKEQG